MSTVTNRITIMRPVEDVFAVLTDVENTGSGSRATSRNTGPRHRRTGSGRRGTPW